MKHWMLNYWLFNVHWFSERLSSSDNDKSSKLMDFSFADYPSYQHASYCTIFPAFGRSNFPLFVG
ncbi:hypothetical protein T06_14305 [Trichinella sp. T6]|nr:hypothetical protein T06_14305 [Trichinella sp. T6]